MLKLNNYCWCCFAILLTACGGGSSGPAPAAPLPPAITEVRADLATYVTDTLNYAQSYSEGYAVPSAAELSAFDALAMDLVGGQLDAVRSAAAAVNLELVRFIDTAAGDNELYCLREVTLLGRGFFCVDFDSAAQHHLSVPHPLYDSNTNTGSVTVLRETGARFLSVSTTHRCANAANSACSGTTSVCGGPGPYKVSDAAHNVDSYFYRFGVVINDRVAGAHTIQLHGCGSAACPSNQDNADIVARLSAGTTMDLPGTELVNALNAELNEELAPLQLGTSLSCSEASMDKQLCGTTNPLGRYINGAANACQEAASSFTSSRWLHVEQGANLRVDDGAGDEITPSTLSRSINDAFGSP
jgi:hypothetical protein